MSTRRNPDQKIRITKRQRQVLMCRDGGMDWPEIATRLKISAEMAKRSWEKARAKIARATR